VRRGVQVESAACAKRGLRAKLSCQCGLTLGLTRAQVQAILGPPQAQRGDKWLYAASVSVSMSDEEAKRRGYPQFSNARTDYPMPIEEDFEKFIVIWFKGDRVNAFRVNLDWVL
jgi:hypothetical protein